MAYEEYDKMLSELFDVLIKYNTGGISDIGCLTVATAFLGEIILGVHNGNYEEANAYLETPAIKDALKRSIRYSWFNRNAN